MFHRNLINSLRTVKTDGSKLLIDHIRAAAAKLHSENNSSPMKVYQKVVQDGHLKKDGHQEEVMKQLQDLYDKLIAQGGPMGSQEINQQSTGSSGGGFFSKLFKPSDKAIKQADLVYGLETTGHRSSDIQLTDPRITGVYLHGDVGCGKTMMMDLFYECLELNIRSKKMARRVHFNRFMLDVHKRLHRIKKDVQMSGRDGRARKEYQDDVIPILADELMYISWIICFDEFQVTDIADAMILKRLFSELWKRGVVCVITGNRKPVDLYKNGLQYQNFAAFIPLIQQHTVDTFINSGIDYRRMEMSSFGDTFILKSDEDCNQRFEQLLRDITGMTGFDQMKSKDLTVFGRRFQVKKSYERVALFNFEELCSQPLGAQDYLEIATYFDCLFIKDLPQIDLQTHRAEARRFITLIDNLYDCRCGVVFLSDAHDENIFTVRDTRRTEWTAEERMFMDDLKIQGTNAAEALSVLSGEDEAFAMARLMSRLYEMKTQEYWDDVKRKIKLHRGTES